MPEKYTEEQRRIALARLAVNDGDYDKTAEETGVTARSLRRWAGVEEKPSIPELLEIVLADLLTTGPSESIHPKTWADTVSVLIDKWLVINEQPTSRIETLFQTMETLADDDLDRVLFRLEALETSLSGNQDGEEEESGSDEDAGELEESSS